MAPPYRRTKVRSGCSVCKIRHVKCDETKPSCLRCTSTGRECSGYILPGPPKRTTYRSKYDVADATPSTDTIRSRPLTALPRLDLCIQVIHTSLSIPCAPSVGMDSIEQRSFHYFATKVSNDIVSYFDKAFWKGLVLQAGNADSTVWHALLALSSCYEAASIATGPSQLPADDRAKQLMRFSLVQYSKAVRLLSRKATVGGLECVLISCLIFVWLEFLQDHLDTALNHLQSGTRILHERLHMTGLRGIGEQLLPLFQRLQIQATLHGSPTFTFDRTATPSFETPQPSTLLEARCALDSIMTAVFDLHRRMESRGSATHLFNLPSLHTLCATYLRNLEAWNKSLQVLVASLPPLPADAQQALHQLELDHLLTTNTLKTFFSTTPLDFDAYNADYVRMVTLSRSILHSQLTQRSPSAVSLPFENRVQAHLFYVVLKCRHLPTRREVVALLQQCPDYEGVWQRESVVEFCEWKIGVEERGRPCGAREEEPLPEEARIYAEKARREVIGGQEVTVVSFKRGAARGFWDTEPDEEMVTTLGMRLAGLVGS